MKWERKDTSIKTENRLIVYYEDSADTTEGLKVNDKDLYQLYILLRDYFNSKDL